MGVAGRGGVGRGPPSVGSGGARPGLGPSERGPQRSGPLGEPGLPADPARHLCLHLPASAGAHTARVDTAAFRTRACSPDRPVDRAESQHPGGRGRCRSRSATWTHPLDRGAVSVYIELCSLGFCHQGPARWRVRVGSLSLGRRSRLLIGTDGLWPGLRALPRPGSTWDGLGELGHARIQACVPVAPCDRFTPGQDSGRDSGAWGSGRHSRSWPGRGREVDTRGPVWEAPPPGSPAASPGRSTSLTPLSPTQRERDSPGCPAWPPSPGSQGDSV